MREILTRWQAIWHLLAVPWSIHILPSDRDRRVLIALCLHGRTLLLSDRVIAWHRLAVPLRTPVLILPGRRRWLPITSRCRWRPLLYPQRWSTVLHGPLLLRHPLP